MLIFVLHYHQALNSGPHFPGILFPGNMVIPVVLPLTLAGRTVNAPVVTQANTYPVCPLHGGGGRLTCCYWTRFLLDTILLEQNRTRLDYLSNPLSIVSSPALRVAGLLDSIPAVKQPLVLATRTDSQFRDANFLDRTHTDDTCRKNMKTPLGKSPDPQVLNPCFSLLNWTM